MGRGRGEFPYLGGSAGPAGFGWGGDLGEVIGWGGKGEGVGEFNGVYI